MRIGAVSYLNTKPLVYGLERLAPEHELVFDLPSRLADDLAAGKLDVALIPSIEYFQNSSYTIVSDACIACRGPVRSVKLLSHVPPAWIRTLAVDEGSRTSGALARVLLREQFDIEPDVIPFPMDSAADEVEADAVVMIGDRAMQPSAGGFLTELDLGDAWCRWTGLPFVFAMWVARGAGVSPALEGPLSEARNLGVAHAEEIANREHVKVGLSYDECLVYLTKHLHFFLGSQERAGLQLFRQHASRLGLAVA